MLYVLVCAVQIGVLSFLWTCTMRITNRIAWDAVDWTMCIVAMFICILATVPSVAWMVHYYPW